jgi:hypothetical protein
MGVSSIRSRIASRITSCNNMSSNIRHAFTLKSGEGGSCANAEQQQFSRQSNAVAAFFVEMAVTLQK